jgi:hypothetical protein
MTIIAPKDRPQGSSYLANLMGFKPKSRCGSNPKEEGLQLIIAVLRFGLQVYLIEPVLSYLAMA